MESEKTDKVTEITEVIRMVADTNKGLVIQDPVQAQLVENLTPIAERIEEYTSYAEEIAGTVFTEAVAKAAIKVEKCIAEDVKAVKGDDILSGIIKGLHQLHKSWKGLENKFVPDMEAARKKIRAARIEWEEEQQRIADEQQRKLQAEADEKARKERERQERLAAYQREKEEKARREAEEAQRKAQEATDEAERRRLEKEAARKEQEAQKAAEQADMREDNAESVTAPVINVQAPKAKGGSRMSMVAEVVNQQAFFNAVAANPQLSGFVDIKLNALASSRRANSMFTVPGIAFKQVRR
jgi:chromosome segregation ATPase